MRKHFTVYSTISVPAEVKRVLEGAKGEEEWGSFLLELYLEAERLRGKEAFEKLAETLTEDELRVIIESSREFREGFKLR